MDSTRRARLQSLILEELSLVISRGLKDPRIPSITLTRVEVTPDAGSATLFFTMLGVQGDESPEYQARIAECLEGLNSASGFLRRHLAKVLTMRTVPTIVFREDKGFANTLRVNELLRQLDNEKKTEKKTENQTENQEKGSDK